MFVRKQVQLLLTSDFLASQNAIGSLCGLSHVVCGTSLGYLSQSNPLAGQSAPNLEVEEAEDNYLRVHGPSS